MYNSQLLCTFTSIDKLNETVKIIKDIYTIIFDKIFILENIELKKELICSYNINSDIGVTDPDNIPKNTISVHRKKSTNTLYTINALNYLVTVLNDGKLDKNFSIPWENYRNTILVTNNNEFRKIKTTIYDIITIEN